jgi:DNA-directed RNA polymerase subunit RPC12/RpoP
MAYTEYGGERSGSISFQRGSSGPCGVRVPYKCCGCGVQHEVAVIRCPECGLLVPWKPKEDK